MLSGLARSWQSTKRRDINMRTNEAAVKSVPDPVNLKNIIYELSRGGTVQSIADLLENFSTPESVIEVSLGDYALIMQVLLDERRDERYCEGLLQHTPSSKVLFSFTDRYVAPF
jgi:hypothetical protein